MIGVVGLGYAGVDERPRDSAYSLKRRRLDEMIHRNAGDPPPGGVAPLKPGGRRPSPTPNGAPERRAERTPRCSPTPSECASGRTVSPFEVKMPTENESVGAASPLATHWHLSSRRAVLFISVCLAARRVCSGCSAPSTLRVSDKEVVLVPNLARCRLVREPQRGRCDEDAGSRLDWVVHKPSRARFVGGAGAGHIAPLVGGPPLSSAEVLATADPMAVTTPVGATGTADKSID